MWRLIVTKSESGFTLMEQLIVIVIVGILSALIAPSFIGMKQRGEVTDATNMMRSALEEVQRQGIMKSTSCFVLLPASNTDLTSASTSTHLLKGTAKDSSGNNVNNPVCLPMGDRLLKNMRIRHNYTTATTATPPTPAGQIKFDFRGNVDKSDNGLIVIQHKDNLSLQKCAIISQPLGLIRLGDYATTDTTGTTEANCSIVQN